MSLTTARTLLTRALPLRASAAKIHTGQCCAAIITNRDWKPGPYPKTEAERRAAAKKYNMVYEDYKPYPEDHPDHMGDYPMLPDIGAEHKNPFGDYDFPNLRRNYGEPMHHNFEWFLRERWNVSYPHQVKPINQLLSFLGVMGVLIGIHAYCAYNNIYFELCEVPITKQYPQEGVVHYTFEPAD